MSLLHNIAIHESFHHQSFLKITIQFTLNILMLENVYFIIMIGNCNKKGIRKIKEKKVSKI